MSLSDVLELCRQQQSTQHETSVRSSTTSRPCRHTRCVRRRMDIPTGSLEPHTWRVGRLKSSTTYCSSGLSHECYLSAPRLL